MSQKVFYNNLVKIRKNRVHLTLNKQAYIGMFILNLSKFHHVYIKNTVTTQDCYSQKLMI